jgi:hypothetical protein
VIVVAVATAVVDLCCFFSDFFLLDGVSCTENIADEDDDDLVEVVDTDDTAAGLDTENTVGSVHVFFLILPLASVLGEDLLKSGEPTGVVLLR